MVGLWGKIVMMDKEKKIMVGGLCGGEVVVKDAGEGIGVEVFGGVGILKVLKKVLT